MYLTLRKLLRLDMQANCRSPVSNAVQQRANIARRYLSGRNIDTLTFIHVIQTSQYDVDAMRVSNKFLHACSRQRRDSLVVRSLNFGEGTCNGMCDIYRTRRNSPHSRGECQILARSKTDSWRMEESDSPTEEPSELPKAILGRVMAAQANFVRVKIEKAEGKEWKGVSLPKKRLLCIVRALLKKMKRQVLVGDRVRVVGIDWVDGRGMVEDVFDRNSKLDEPPVANISRVVLVFSLDMPPFLPSAATRYLLTAEEAGLPVTVVLNKCDLVTDDTIKKEQNRLTSWGYDSVAVSVTNNIGLDRLEQLLQHDISVVAGPSGAGKSSIINALSIRSRMDGPGIVVDNDGMKRGEAAGGSYRVDESALDLQEVGDVSERIGRGKHTTRNVKIIELDGGGALVDTPGFNQPSLGFPPSRLQSCFPEIRRIVQNQSCTFNDCRHMTEPGCVVRGDWERYPMYLEIYQELEEIDALMAKRAASKRKREGSVRQKRGAGGRVREEARLETKTHRRVSRRSINQEISEITRDHTILNDNEDA